MRCTCEWAQRPRPSLWCRLYWAGNTPLCYDILCSRESDRDPTTDQPALLAIMIKNILMSILENLLEHKKKNIRCTHEVCTQTYSWGGQCTLAANLWVPTAVHGSIWKHAGQMVSPGRVPVKTFFWPCNPDIWPLTLTFKVAPDTTQVDPWPIFGNPRTNGSSVSLLTT